MKPNRIAQWSMDTEARSKEYQELCESYGYKELGWNERQALKEAMSDKEWAEFSAENDKLYAEVRAEWQDIMSKHEEVGQVKLNIRNNELDAFCSVFQRADRILTGLANCEVNVSEDKTPIPAWSDGKSVTFNVSSIKTITEDTLMSLHGLNYHEVGHLLYTPRVGSDLGAWVKEQGDVREEREWDYDNSRWTTTTTGDVRYRYAFNLLEDFRSENYLITKYPSVQPFLQAVVAQYAIDSTEPDEFDSVFILLAGRPYFADSLIRLTAGFYARAYGLDKTKQLYTLSNEYRKLVFPKDYARAKEIIKLIAEFLPKFPPLPSGCNNRPVMRNGRTAGQVEQSNLAGSMEEGLSQEELNKMFDELMSGEQSQDGEAGQGAGQSDSGNADTANAKSANTDSKTLPNELVKALEEAVEQVKQSDSVRKKLDETNKAIRKATGNKTILPRQPRSTETPKQADVVAVNAFTQELERLRIDSDPDWKRELPTGKLNVRRAMQADVNDINKLFDRWATGNDDYDIEAVILLDRSGSMYHEINTACKASWIIKRSLEKINASVSVLTFNDTSRVLYSADEKAQATYASVLSSGSTDPEYALYETERIMQGSKRKTKLLFMLTDGQFYGGKSDDTIKRLKDLGVHTNLVFLGGEGWVKWATENGEQVSHGVHNFRVITKPLDLVKVAKDVVRHHLAHA